MTHAYPIRMPTGVWCLWDPAKMLPLHLGAAWNYIYSTLSEKRGDLKEARDEMLAALDDEDRWARVLEEVESNQGKVRAHALRRRTDREKARNNSSIATIRHELTRDRAAEALAAREASKASGLKRYHKRRAAQKSKATPTQPTAQDEEPVPEPFPSIDPHTPDTLGRLSMCDGAPSGPTIRKRARSKDPKWAHYRAMDPSKASGDFLRNVKEVYCIDAGTTWEELDVDTLADVDEEVEQAPEADEEESAPVELTGLQREASELLLEIRQACADKDARIEDLEASLEQAVAYADERDDELDKAKLELEQLRNKLAKEKGASGEGQADEIAQKLAKETARADAASVQSQTHIARTEEKRQEILQLRSELGATRAELSKKTTQVTSLGARVGELEELLERADTSRDEGTTPPSNTMRRTLREILDGAEMRIRGVEGGEQRFWRAMFMAQREVSK